MTTSSSDLAGLRFSTRALLAGHVSFAESSNTRRYAHRAWAHPLVRYDGFLGPRRILGGV